MKRQTSHLLLILSLIATVLTLDACSALQTGGTHQMGPPGRSKTMPNGFMLQQSDARDSDIYRSR